jgi:hypothetical protein
MRRHGHLSDVPPLTFDDEARVAGDATSRQRDEM